MWLKVITKLRVAIYCERITLVDEVATGQLLSYRYVLLKERNMIMTMEEEYKRQGELFPNPERLEKVQCFNSPSKQIC